MDERLWGGIPFLGHIPSETSMKAVISSQSAESKACRDSEIWRRIAVRSFSFLFADGDVEWLTYLCTGWWGSSQCFEEYLHNMHRKMMSLRDLRFTNTCNYMKIIEARE